MAGKAEDMKMRTITCFGDRTSGTFFNIIASNEDNSVSRKDNFVNVNVFNSVYSLTVAFCTIS